MLQLRGLQDDSKHEELQRIRKETVLLRVSSRYAGVFGVSPLRRDPSGVEALRQAHVGL